MPGVVVGYQPKERDGQHLDLSERSMNNPAWLSISPCLYHSSSSSAREAPPVDFNDIYSCLRALIGRYETDLVVAQNLEGLLLGALALASACLA